MNHSMPGTPPHPSPTVRVYANPCPLSQWCHPTISSSVTPFFCCPQSFPASGSFPMSRIFTSGGQNNGGSASASVLPMKIQDQFPLGLTGLISLLSKVLLRVFSSTLIQKHPKEPKVLRYSIFFMVQLSYLYMTLGKNVTLTRWIFVTWKS